MRGEAPDTAARAALVAFGCFLEDAPRCTDYPIWPQHETAVAVFLACATQWIVHAGMSVWWQGLDYCRVESALRLMGIRRKHWPGLFAQIRVLERAARESLE